MTQPAKSKPLSKGTLGLLQDAINTASVLGIERMVIDSHSLRGDSQDNGTMMIYPFPKDTELEFGSMGISRIGVLRARMRLLDNEGSVTPEYKVRDSGEKFVFRLELKRNKTKIDFKCADPSQIRAPKALNDPDHFGFKFSEDDIKLMLRGKAAMQSELVTLESKDGKSIEFSISASEGDVLRHELESVLDTKTDRETFVVTYKSKFLFPLLKEIIEDAKDGEMIDVLLTNRGILKIEVNGIPTYLFPEV